MSRDLNHPTSSTAPRREIYLSYLQTPQWRKTRDRALRLAEWKCQGCGSKRDLEVHHQTYDRLGYEHDSDLAVLCRACHRGEHLERAEPERLGLYVKLAHQAFGELGPHACVADVADMTKTLCARVHIPYLRHEVDKAVALIMGKRLPNGVLPTRAQEIAEIADMRGREPTKDEAQEFLCRVFGGPYERLIKRMPEARLAKPRDTDRAKALQIVFAEIADSITRCEALEADDAGQTISATAEENA